MPSPFPGMDPFLEEPGLWPDVHHGLISELQARLNSLVRPKYHVRVEERVYISDENDPGRRVIIPDLRVAEVPGSEHSPFAPGGTALEVAEPVVVTTLLQDEIHEAYLEVIDRELRNVVTVIEILSPTNKITGSRGQESYRRKRQEVMNSPSHWVEIDLLRQGTPFVVGEVLPACEYLLHVSRVEERPKARVWPIRLHQRLPVLPIPLKTEDQDARVDLQTILNTAYERGAYDLEVDYRGDPVPPLSAEQAEWAHKLLTEKGLR